MDELRKRMLGVEDPVAPKPSVETLRAEEHEARKDLVRKVIKHLQESMRRGWFKTSIHWDDCDMDCRCFWIYVLGEKEELVKPGYPRKFMTHFRSAILTVKRAIEKGSPYKLIWERESGPTRLYYSGAGPASGRFKDLSQDHWVYKLHLQG